MGTNLRMCTQSISPHSLWPSLPANPSVSLSYIARCTTGPTAVPISRHRVGASPFNFRIVSSPFFTFCIRAWSITDLWGGQQLCLKVNGRPTHKSRASLSYENGYGASSTLKLCNFDPFWYRKGESGDCFRTAFFLLSILRGTSNCNMGESRNGYGGCSKPHSIMLQLHHTRGEVENKPAEKAKDISGMRNQKLSRLIASLQFPPWHTAPDRTVSSVLHSQATSA